MTDIPKLSPTRKIPAHQVELANKDDAPKFMPGQMVWIDHYRLTLCMVLTPIREYRLSDDYDENYGSLTTIEIDGWSYELLALYDMSELGRFKEAEISSETQRLPIDPAEHREVNYWLSKRATVPVVCDGNAR